MVVITALTRRAAGRAAGLNDAGDFTLQPGIDGRRGIGFHFCIHRPLERLARSELHVRGGRNLDLFTGRWISSCPRGALPRCK